MSTPYSAFLASVSQQIVTYVGMTTVIVGVIGNLLNILVFLSLQTFRQNSCAFYLTILSFVNIGQLLTGQFSRVMITGFGMDFTSMSLGYCKFRSYGVQVFSYISYTCLCFATIDQFLATCVRVYWQQWSNIKLAQRLSALSVIFWILYGIPYFIYYNQTISSTGKPTCSNTDANFRQYHSYVNNTTLTALPVLITIIFGSLAYRNVRQIAYRTVPLVRRELDKQLTNMVLIYVVFSCFFLLPYNIIIALSAATNLNSNPDTAPQFSLGINITACIFYFYFACPFYIYVCVSERFRQQLIYVLFELHFNRFKRRRARTVLPLPA